MICVYIKTDKHVEITSPGVCVGDVTKVFCSQKELEERIRALPLFQFEMADNGHKKTASVLTVIKAVTAQLDEEDVCVINTGAEDFAMSLNFAQKDKEKTPWQKIIPVMLVTFFGSGFAIMTYNEDVDTMGVFEKIAGITGADALGMKLMVIAYAAGIAIGIILFFNHFGRRKLTSDPTPMEVEMEKYESDVEDTWIKEASRKGKSIDIS